MATVLQDLSNDLANAVEQAGAGVVRVEGRKRFPATGIVWDTNVVVTAHHVVTRDENIKIGLPNGDTTAATLAGRDPSTDLAVLRTQASLQRPTWAENQPRVGQLVLALGRPGDSVQAALGIIGTVGDGWRTPAGGAVDHYVQTDVVMYPGFSGGPLVSAGGEILGLNTSALLRDVSVTVPTSTIRRVVEALLAHGRVKRGYLGIGTQPVRLPDNLAQQVGQETGLMLMSVEPDSPAAKGNLLLGDVIVGISGEPVRHLDDLFAQLSGDRVGTSVPVRIVRGGQIQEVAVTVGERE
jgi:S1-C subfamily serine protease